MNLHDCLIKVLTPFYKEHAEKYIQEMGAANACDTVAKLYFLERIPNSEELHYIRKCYVHLGKHGTFEEGS